MGVPIPKDVQETVSNPSVWAPFFFNTKNIDKTKVFNGDSAKGKHSGPRCALLTLTVQAS